jgi:hypothetical protein
MIKENTDRQLNVSARMGIPAVWINQGYHTRARCPFCGHVVEPLTTADEH